MKLWKLASAMTALVLSSSVDAALVGRLAATEGGTDYQAYYDTEANLTWLADANYSYTSGFDSTGLMNWAEANTWATGLSIEGVNGWRLPDTEISCINYNCNSSELGNLFYNVLGGSSTSSITTTHNANYDLFSNIMGSYYSTEYISGGWSWWFNMNNGYQDYMRPSSLQYVWAVQSGDVSAVPVPAAAWLFGSGLIGLAGFARRKKA